MGSYLSAEMQLAHSTAQADWTNNIRIDYCKFIKKYDQAENKHMFKG